MKNKFKFLIIILILYLLSIVGFAKAEDNLTILFTHDIHDNLEPSNIIINEEIESRGGFGRLSTAISREKEIDNELLLLDAGDYSMGTLFQTIFSTHSPSLRIMGRLGYDATTFGNHEFDFRSNGLSNSLKAAVQSGDKLPEIIASNTKFPNNIVDESLSNLQNSFNEYGVKDYLILNKNNIKIGIIGLMGKDADSNAPTAEVEFTDIVEESKYLVDILENKEEVDLIIALSHSGTEGKKGKTEDEILAKKVPEIDVIISAHSHTTLLEPIIIGNTIIASFGKYGENLGIMKIEKDSNKWHLKDYNIKRIDNNYEKDTEIEEIIDDFRKDVEKEYLSRFNLRFNEVIAHSSFNFTPFSEIGKVQEEEPLGYLIGDAYKHAIKKAERDNYINIDAAIVASGVIRDSFTEGDIMVKDAFNVSSLGIGKDGISGYPLVDVYLNGKELRAAAEVDASIQPIMSPAQLYISGLKYSFNPNRIIFNKITDIRLDTENGDLELEDNKLYRVVGNLYGSNVRSCRRKIQRAFVYNS